MGTASCDLPEPNYNTEAVPHAVWWIALFAVFLRLVVAAASQFTNEDAYITLRYATHIAQGQGFVYNLGEHVLGTTTPLYTLLLALFQKLGLPALACGKLLNILADGALCVVMARWASALLQARLMGRAPRRHSGTAATNASEEPVDPNGGVKDTIGIIAALLVALNPVQIRWAISGMETGLVTLCGAWIWLQYTRRRYNAAYIALGLLFLLRWDSALLLLVLSVAVAGRERRLPWRELLLYAALVAPWILFAYRYFGNPIPVTAASKMTVYGWRASHDPTWLGRRLPQLGKLLMVYVGSPIGALMTLAAGIGLSRILREGRGAVLPPVAWALLYWIAFLLSRVLLFPWYMVPPLPIYDLLAAIGIQRSGKAVAQRCPGVMRSLPGWGVVCVAFAGMGVAVALACRETQRTEGAQNRQIGLWLKAQAQPADRVMLEPIGYIGYYSQLKVIDVVGLVTPETLFAYTPSQLAPMRAIALRYRPEWCVLRPGEVQHIQDADRVSGIRWADLYQVAHVFTMPRSGKEPIVFTVYHRL